MGRALAERVQQSAAVQNQQPPSIGSLIQQLRPEIARALPKHMDADRMARIALTVLRKEPKLGNCSPDSFMGALLTAAQLGLEPGASGEAYLVPYGRECQFIVGYQGYAKLFWQHPLAKHLDAQAVYEADEFDYAYGLDPFLRHKPAMGDRGEVIAYYAVAKLVSGASAFVVLSPEDVRALRKKEGPNGGIQDPMHWMERKTAVRQLVKLLPKSPELARALDWDEKVRTDLREDAIDAAPADDGEHPVIEQASAAVDTAAAPPAPAEDVQDAETVDVESVTAAQNRKIHALFRDLGMADDEDRQRAGMSRALNREVASRKDLSKADAAFIIESLEIRLAQQQEQPKPADDVEWPEVAQPAGGAA